MSLRFRGSDLRPVLTEAIAGQCRVILVKDQGVYFLAEQGERRPDGRVKLLAYAVGCNPDTDPFDADNRRIELLVLLPEVAEYIRRPGILGGPGVPSPMSTRLESEVDLAPVEQFTESLRRTLNPEQ